MEQDVICRHSEFINNATHVGTCKHCGQQLQYDEYERKIIRVLRRGEKDGVQTMVTPISVKEEAKQKKEQKEAQESPAPSSSLETTPAPAVLEVEPEPAEDEEPPPHYGTRKPHFDKRREKILIDYGLMTITDLEIKWKMARGYFYFLRKRWKDEGVTFPTAYVDRPDSEKHARRDSLPPFPTFNDSWSWDVQIEWIRAYKELKLAVK